MPRLLETLAFSALVAVIGIQNSLAGPEADTGDKKHVAVFIDKQNDGDAKVDLKVNGERYEFSLPTLSEGESRTLTTDDGKPVQVMRKNNQVTASIGKDVFNLPNFDGKEQELIASFQGQPEGKVKIITKRLNTQEEDNSLPIGAMSDLELDELKKSIVISGSKLTDDEQKKIKEAIKKAGISKEVKFIQGAMVMSTLDSGNLSISKDGELERNITIIHSDDNKDEEKQVKIIRKVEKKEVEKK